MWPRPVRTCEDCMCVYVSKCVIRVCVVVVAQIDLVVCVCLSCNLNVEHNIQVTFRHVVVRGRKE